MGDKIHASSKRESYHGVFPFMNYLPKGGVVIAVNGKAKPLKIKNYPSDLAPNEIVFVDGTRYNAHVERPSPIRSAI